MSLRLFKLQGCGNDFLFFDSITGNAPNFSSQEVRMICDRNFGAGADGLIVLEQSQQALAKWKFFNGDGSSAEMCGNAARCAILYLTDKYFPDTDLITLETENGVIKGRKLENNLVEVMLLPPESTAKDYDEKVLKIGDEAIRTFNINTGVPHAVIEVDDLKAYPIEKVGRQLVRHEAFGSDGTNVTFFQKQIGNEISSTTFERGVERETFACGTGVAAAALVFSQQYFQSLPVTVYAPGGTLIVDYSSHSGALLLKGPAHYVMESELNFPLSQDRGKGLFSKKGTA